jgi:hypothetical protein
MLEKITDGRTDLVFEYLAEGHAANAADRAGVSLIQWCAYYGDVSATAMQWSLAFGAGIPHRNWHRRQCPYRKLLYGNFRIHPDHEGMAAYLRGKPQI